MRISHAGLSSLTELTEVVHSLGAKLFVQLTAGFGRVAIPLQLRHQPVSASAIPSFWKPEITCRELKTEEVERLVKSFGDAAEMLVSAGIDGIELHGHEGYLFDQFTTAIWNRRTDKYGGDLNDRLRLPIEVLQEIRRRVGQTFPVQYRYGLKHYIKALNSGALPGEQFIEVGRDIEEGLQMARMLEEAGFDALHVDAGCYDSWYWPHPPIYQDYGCMMPMASAVKKAVRIPVIAVGKLAIPQLAALAIAEGKADIVAIGKGLLADAFWVNKVGEEQTERIRPCIGCHDGCIGRLIKARPLSCAVNPAVGRERAYRLERTEEPRKVVVVGGGVAGMEAARVASLRGHQVTLFERANSVGGHLVEASVPDFKKDLARLLAWYKGELGKLNLEIKLGAEVNVEIMERERPEVVVIATGSRPTIPDVPGIAGNKVVTATDILLGEKKAKDQVLVLGGGLIGCETALWLAQQGKKTTIVETLSELMIAGIPVQIMNRLMLLNLLNFYNVKVITNSSLIEVSEDGVVLTDEGLGKRILDVDTVVLATGLSPEQEFYKSLRAKVANLFLIGDSRKPQNVMNAIWDAYEVARMI